MEHSPEQILKALTCWIKNFDGKAINLSILCEATALILALIKENDGLHQTLDDKCDRCIERERADTVREFANRLIASKTIVNGIEVGVVPYFVINDIAKEMINNGEKEN